MKTQRYMERFSIVKSIFYWRHFMQEMIKIILFGNYIILDKSNQISSQKFVVIINYLRINMEQLAALNKDIAEIIPGYEYVSDYAIQKYKTSVSTVSKIYEASNKKVDQARKSSNKLKKQVNWLLNQSADEILSVFEEKLGLADGKSGSVEMTKKARVQRIMKQITQAYVSIPLNKLGEYSGALVQQGKVYSDKYLLPMYISLKATLIVSKEMILEMIERRLSKLKMTYEVSKDTVTMIISGDFSEQKILEKVETSMQSFKQLTIKVVQKGLQIKIPKKELFNNYQHFIVKLLEVVDSLKNKGQEQIKEATEKTMSLYKSVMNRIKEKQIQIRTQYLKDKREIKSKSE